MLVHDESFPGVKIARRNQIGSRRICCEEILASRSVVRRFVARRSMPVRTPGQHLFQNRAVGGLRLVGSIEWQRLSTSAARMPTDPRVLVREAPGLDRRAPGTIQTCSHNIAIYFSLANQIFCSNQAAGIHRQRNVQLRDVNLKTKRRETRNVRGECRNICIEQRYVHLQPYTMNGNSTLPKILNQGVDGVRLPVQSLALRFVIEEERLRVGFVRPAEYLLNVLRSLFGKPNARPVIPDRFPNVSLFI